MSLLLGIATLHWEGWARCVRSWNSHALFPRATKIVEGKRVVYAYQEIYESARVGDVIGYLHDDVVCLEQDWDQRVMREFVDPAVGLVGFGGALRHGAPDMYRTPYTLSQLGRSGFLSNLREAEVHGKRFTGECDVAVVDGLAMFVRRSVLAEVGGWPLGTAVDYISYDYWISCMTRRHGYKIRLVGVACDHLGGKSTGLNKGLEVDFDGAHRYIYDNFRDCLPYEVAQ